MDNAKDLLSKRKEKANGLKADGINLFPNGLAVEHTIRDIGDHIERLSDEQPEDPTRFTVAGRMMAINRFGKSAFIRFRDRTGMVQAYVRKDKVGTTGYDLFKRLDVGDFVRISGDPCFAPRPANGPFWPPPLTRLQVHPAPSREVSWVEGSGKTLPATLH
jgi:lysyl-tRNA synthetase class 2